MGLALALCHHGETASCLPPSMTKFLALLTSLLLISGCQSISTTKPAAPAAAPEQPAIESQPQRYASFSEETLFALLSAELAGQRDRYDIALNNYNEQAKTTQDPVVAERAYHIAEYLSAEPDALNNAMIWARVAPNSLDAQRASAIQLARAGRLDEAMTHMEQVLQQQGETHFDFLALSATESDASSRAGLLQSFDRLLVKYPENGQLLFGKALLLQQDNQPEAALAVLQSQPAGSDEVVPLLLHTRLLQSLNRSDEAQPLLEQGLQQYPDDKRLRLAYARLLVEQERLDEARSEFEILLQQSPDDDDLRLSLALISLQQQNWESAKYFLRELVERDSHTDIAHYNLGQIDEQFNDNEGALIEYGLVSPGDQYLAAQSRLASILIDSGRNEEAQSRLNQARKDWPEYAIPLYLLEAESLSQAQQVQAAWQLIQQATQEFPDDTNLLYTRAMLAEERDDLAGLERDLKLVISREPDNAMAMNALGYTLADRTDRYAEAKQLIERAHQLKPEDPAILDSLGWVNFRMGNLAQAEILLQQAIALFPDQEIAAHLGEVLWAQGKQQEAREVWAAAYKKQPEGPVLRETLLRLTGSEKP